MIQVWEIEERLKPFWANTAGRSNFALRAGGEATPAVLVEDPNVTLYCFDPVERCAVFVRTPESVSLTGAPFFFAAQYDHAQQVLTVPYEMFHELASSLPAEGMLVHIHSTGRAGSTLVSKAFAEMDATTSLSEPDVYTQAVEMRLDGVPDEELIRLLKSAVPFLFKPSFARGSSLRVVKHRSFAMEIADLIAQADPDAGYLFLYRDLAPYMLSAARGFDLLSTQRENHRAAVAALSSYVSILRHEAEQREVEGVEIGCCVWLSAMDAFVRFHGQGVAMLPVRYEELVERPAEVLGAVLAYLGLPLTGVNPALRAFARDSQAGSPLARDEVVDPDARLEEQHWNLVRALLQRYPLMEAGLAEGAMAVP
jgi:hypothetical protein